MAPGAGAVVLLRGPKDAITVAGGYSMAAHKQEVWWQLHVQMAKLGQTGPNETRDKRAELWSEICRLMLACPPRKVGWWQHLWH